MSVSERTSVSGTALSYLLKECITNNNNKQEGFLFGNITENVTNHISDTRSDNARLEILINITSMLPIPETGLFYSPSGSIKENILNDMLDEMTSSNVVGWYHFRQNNSLKPTLRDKLVSKSLFKYFHNKMKYFVFCSITFKQSLSNSTHTYSYRFYKVTRQHELEPLIDLTNNLGENVSGYKRAHSGDKNDEFNKAVMEATKDGMHSVAEAVRITLDKAAADAAIWEAKSRELTSDINCMLAMLANHYQAKQSNVSKNVIKQEEQEIIKPLVEVISAPVPKRAEPFDFVTDIIRNNLKPSMDENIKMKNMSGDHSSNFGDEIASTSNSGHKRVHSAGPSFPDLDISKSNSHSPNWDTLQAKSSPSTSNNPQNNLTDA